MFGVWPDRFDHEVEFVGAIDLACHRVGHSGPEGQGFGEVVEPVNALRVEVPQQDTAYFQYSVGESRNR